jgi:hypothetical protein
MNIRHVLGGLVFVILASRCVALPFQCASQSSCAPIELTFNDVARRGTDFVLEYGLLRNDQATETKIGVRNVLAETLPIRVASTNDVSLSWSDDAPTLHSVQATFSRNQQRYLTISVNPDAGDPVPVIRFSLGGVLIGTLSLSFLATDYKLPIQAGGSYTGNSSSLVNLCVKKVLTGYKLDCQSAKINDGALPSGRGKCSKNVNCNVSNGTCDSPPDQHPLYCVQVTPASAGGTINFDANFTADYLIDESPPQLVLLSEVKEANRLIVEKQKCADDWNQFLSLHKTEEQFEIMSEVGGNLRFRSEPCDFAQWSYVGIAAKSDGQWADFKFAGLRTRTTGRPVLVGIVGFGEPLFNNNVSERLGIFAPGPSATMEIMILRDATYVVGTFALGGETPGDRWGVSFGLGSSVTAFDNPPPGMHTYTAKVRYIGDQKFAYVAASGRFIAFELPKGGHR